MIRFWDKVNKDGDCWNWTASKTKFGYGRFSDKNKKIYAHRFSWYLKYNKWPTQWILHKCDNTSCVNPSHLFEGSPKENTQDSIMKGGFFKNWDKSHKNFKPNPNSTLRKRKLSFKEAEDIRKIYFGGMHEVMKLAHTYNISRSALYNIFNHVTYKVAS